MTLTEEYLVKEQKKKEERKRFYKIFEETLNIPNSKGIFKRRCPFCGSHIKNKAPKGLTQTINDWHYGKYERLILFYKCDTPNCGYRKVEY